MTEKLEKKVTNLTYAVAGITVILALLVVYFFTQFNALDTRVDQELFNQNTQLAGRLTSIESKVAELEYLNPYQEVTLYAFYDSSCTACNNEFVTNMNTAALSKNNIQLQKVDVAGQEGVPLERVPAFYSLQADAINNQGLANFFNNELAGAGFSVEYAGDAVVAFAPGITSRIGAACEGEKPLVQVFYLSDSMLGSQAMANAKSFFSPLNESVDFQQYCIALNETDESKCIADIGSEAFEEGMELYETYSIGSEDYARSIVDCKYEFSVLDYSDVQAAFCSLYPEYCEELIE